MVSNYLSAPFGAAVGRRDQAFIDKGGPVMGPWHWPWMHIVSHKAIRIFCEEYPYARTALDRWYRVAKRATWSSFAEVKQSFNAADSVAPHVVFDIGGNKYRLIAEVNFMRRVLFIRGIMTHKEYVKGAWKL